MESQRTFLLIGLLVVSLLLFREWQIDETESKAETSAVTQVATSPSNTDQADIPASSEADVPVAQTQAVRSVITVTTDVFAVKIDTKGGDIVEAKLLQHAETHGSDIPYLLLGEFDGKQYLAQSGLIGLNGPDASSAGRPVYQTEQSAYTLSGGELRVPLTFIDNKGIQFTKTFVFKAGQYDVSVEYDVVQRD